MTPDPRLKPVRRDVRLLSLEAIKLLGDPVSKLQNRLRRRRRLARGGRFIPPVEVPSLGPNAQKAPHVVFCGPSYGEFIMMERVARALQNVREDVSFSYCLRDPGAILDLRRTKPDLRTVAWPEDRLGPILKWLEEEKPDLLILVERFRYPVLIAAAARYGTKVALINGRSRARKGLKYQLFGAFYRWQFAGFSAMAMQREDYFQAAQESAPSTVQVMLTGDIKTDLNPPSSNPDLAAWIPHDLPLFAAGSTETSEEEQMVLSAFRLLSGRLLIAPRQPRAIEGLLKNLKVAGLTYSRRSEGGPPAQVMILDTMGELTAAYEHCVAAYVGGSFTEGGGGHNVMEPLLSGVPVAYGTRRGHFEALQKLAEAEGVGFRISDAEELAAFWQRFADHPDERTAVGEKGKALLERSRGAIARTVETLIPLLP